ncbi:YicC/YloC family endoribonuclease [Ruminococcus sp.]|uniref:YicC/YloC family endoribonuclease n=1 Tax=Ruminococcus sp. TaxID=41978 RepID=UPI0028732710|nr:YicC/YloC family endoribonuclease [Ruminococcus sp.]
MMVMSMTGFGRAELSVGNRDIIVEIKSVNHRYFEFSCRTSRGYNFLEDKLKKYVAERVSRGKVDMYVSVTDNDDSSVEVELNKPLASGYINAMRAMVEEYGVKDDISVSTLSRFNDVFQITRPPADEDAVFADVKVAVDAALEHFLSMRQAEGEKLKADILSRAQTIIDIVGEIEERSPQTVQEYRDRLYAKLSEVLQSTNIDDQRILTEAAIFADKVAVDEETVRLRSHFDQMKQFLDSGVPVGRKLDFIVQEMNREANTIGSKVNDSALAHKVVDIKGELEKIREQVQNIE